MSPTQHFLYPDTDPRHRKAVEEAVNAQESEPQDALAEALHDAMCDISHHDRPPARCSKWATYPNIAASVLPRLRAALVRTPETLDVEPVVGNCPECDAPIGGVLGCVHWPATPSPTPPEGDR